MKRSDFVWDITQNGRLQPMSQSHWSEEPLPYSKKHRKTQIESEVRETNNWAEDRWMLSMFIVYFDWKVESNSLKSSVFLQLVNQDMFDVKLLKH